MRSLCPALFLLLQFVTGSQTNLLLAQSNARPVVVSAQIRLEENQEAIFVPGESFTVEVIADITREKDSKGKSWHIYPQQSKHRGVERPTKINVAESSSAKAGSVIWPKTKFTRNALGQPQPVYEGRTFFEIPVAVAASAEAGEQSLEIAFSYQTCASLCLAPTTENLTVTFTVRASESATTERAAKNPETDSQANAEMAENSRPTQADADKIETQDSIEADPQASLATKAAEPDSETKAAPPAEATSSKDFSTNVFGTQFGFSSSSMFAIPMLLGFSFIGGFLLNLTPCVLPIIPIKIMGITKSSEGSARRARILGFTMGLGILAFWLVIGAAICFVSGFDSISSLFQRPAFGISVGLFIAFMGIGMIVDMAVMLPQSVYQFNPKQDTTTGAFFFGVMTAVLSTPCTAPFMGSAAAWATRANNSVLVLAVFGAIAIGMGWPYVLLSCFPKLVSKVPKTGPASSLVKQILGLLMLAIAAFFGGTGLLGLVKENPHLGPVLHWWVATVCVAGMAFWLAMQTFAITKSWPRRIFFSSIGLALLAGMTLWALDETRQSFDDVKMHLAEEQATKNYIAELETALRNGGKQASKIRPPAWRAYDPEAHARAKADGHIAIVHFTADW